MRIDNGISTGSTLYQLLAINNLIDGMDSVYTHPFRIQGAEMLGIDLESAIGEREERGGKRGGKGRKIHTFATSLLIHCS
jgi:hypothetical protein